MTFGAGFKTLMMKAPVLVGLELETKPGSVFPLIRASAGISNVIESLDTLAE